MLPEGPEPHTADIADPNYAKYIAEESTCLFARLEEIDPADPNELSGARLWIHEIGTYTNVAATFGENLQFDGSRLQHYFGALRDETTASVAVTDPTAAEEGFSLGFSERSGGPCDRVRLVLSAGGNAALRLELGGYCLGVLRGELLARFFYCVRKRRALKIAE